MRLLNTTSMTVEEFVGQDMPPYAILSHTWAKEEVLLVDILSGTASSKKGYAKIRGCCAKAAEHGFHWVWIDTCCIDKTSSAELSEAINSMYHWYERSTICYVYLQDVAVGDGGSSQLWRFGASRWFTRGWTLQELVAPAAVEFYSFEWREIGTKGSLAEPLFSLTGIPVSILNGESPASCSVAVRMSWASTRQTTREEDMAYCLLGLFNVNMPLLYGEGTKAFVRLQEQILRQEEDYTLFTWTLQHECGDELTGFLASTPREFSSLVPANLQQPTITEPLHLHKDKRKELRIDSQAFANQSGIGIDLGYSILHDKNYSNTQKYHLQSATAKYAPKQPPAVTSRGLVVTLPVMRPKDSTIPVIAWMYCELDDRLLCVGLGPCAASSRLHGRRAAPWLIAVDKALLEEFEPEEMLLHPNGMVEYDGPIKAASLGSGSIWDQDAPSLGRLQILTPDNPNYSLYVISAYPMNRWSLDEFFFPSLDCELVGAALVEYASGRRSSCFMVTSGIYMEQPWCVVSELTDSPVPGGDVVSIIEQTYHDLSMDMELRRTYSDRAAVLSENIRDTVVTCAIRRVPQSRQHSRHAYSLRMEAHKLAQCDPWVKHLLGLTNMAI